MLSASAIATSSVPFTRAASKTSSKASRPCLSTSASRRMPSCISGTLFPPPWTAESRKCAVIPIKNYRKKSRPRTFRQSTRPARTSWSRSAKDRSGPRARVSRQTSACPAAISSLCPTARSAAYHARLMIRRNGSAYARSSTNWKSPTAWASSSAPSAPASAHAFLSAISICCSSSGTTLRKTWRHSARPTNFSRNPISSSARCAIFSPRRSTP